MSEREQAMTDQEQWQRNNEVYLGAALHWLRLRLQQLAGPSGDPPPADLEQVEASMAEAGALEPQPALCILGNRFGLSRFEQEVLLLCSGIELDTRIAGLCALAQHDPSRTYPTFALALALFDNPAWDVLSPERPLRYWRFLEINQPGGQPLTTSPLRADERIVNYIKGLNYLDDRLTPLLVPFEVAAHEPLAPSQEAACASIEQTVRVANDNGTRPVIQLIGIDRASVQLVAQRAARALHLSLYRLPAEVLPQQAAELETLARLWQRDSLLLPIALFIDAHEYDGSAETKDGGAPRSAAPLQRFLSRSQGVFFLGTREIRSGLGAAIQAVEVGKPTPAEQRTVWAETLGEDSGESPAMLAGQFDLNTFAIRQIVRTSRADTSIASLHDRLWKACLLSTGPRMDRLAQRIHPIATRDDIVLPEEEMSLLHQIASQVAQRTRVYDDWGFRRRMNRGLGISALFAGESGTGKTMAAEVIANQLRLHLYRIDLSAVVSKYIGETEKNLRQLFDAAEAGGAILFFDEADALFGKRSEVRDSHDRYANIEINYLLQRIESYQGLAILATNMKSALDDAFMRRLRFVINFPFPAQPQRRAIWERAWPSETPLGELDYDRLARLRLAGGSIANVALSAAFMAAERGSAVTMPGVLDAARAEYNKLERPINDADFRWDELARSKSPPNPAPEPETVA